MATANWLLAVPILLLLGLAIGAIRHRDPRRLAPLALAALGAAAAVGLNLLAGHLYFRLQPDGERGPRRGDSSFFAVYAAAAAALAVGLLGASRRWGLTAAGIALLVGLGGVATGANYPLDVLVGLAVGAACAAALLPARHPTQRLADRLLHTHTVPAPGTVPARSHERRLGVVAVVLLATSVAGWSPASKTTGCASRWTAPTLAWTITCRPTPGCTARPASSSSPPAAGGPPAPASTGRSPTSTGSWTATSTWSSRRPTAASWCWRSSPSCPSLRPTTMTASPPGGSCATTACTIGGSCTRWSAGPTG